MSTKTNLASYMLATSQLFLAGAFIYFTFELSRIATQIPEILSSVEKTSEKIEPFITEIGELRAQIPTILKEAEAIRQQIPPVLDEVKQIRAQLPSVLAEVKAVREQIPSILDEVKEVRIIIPDVLTEVKRSREAIPPMLAQGEQMIGEASKTGRRVSEGAVTGVITGIFKTPFKLVGGIGRSLFGPSVEKIKGLTDDDENIVGNTIAAMLKDGTLGEKRNWVNPDSGNDGIASIIAMKVLDGQECRVINNIIRINGEAKVNMNVTACLNDDSEWEILNE